MWEEFLGYSYAILLTNSVVKNTKVSGTNQVGGMAGYKYDSVGAYYNMVDNCKIYGSGINVGGLCGYGIGIERFAEVRETNVEASSINSSNLGGMVRTGWNTFALLCGG